MRTLSWALSLVLACGLFVHDVAAQPLVRLSSTNPGGLEIFFLKDFDIYSPGTGPPIFLLTMLNDNVARENVTLVMTISTQRFGDFARGQTKAFALNPNQVVRLSSNDLFTNTGRYRLADFTVDDNIVADLLKDILSTSRLPADVYIFRVELPAGNQSVSSADIEIRVTNPRKLDLIFPGTAATGRRDDCIEIFTRLPQFRWESDMKRFRVIIAEAKPGEDPESALNQEPRFIRNFVIQGTFDRSGLSDLVNASNLQGRVEVIPGTSFQYPSSGEVLTFRPGRTYYWRVTGLIESSSGPIPLQGEIFCFRMARIDELGTGRQQIMFILQNFLGSDAEKLFAEGGELEGYRPRKVLFDGKETTLPEILTRLQDLNERYQGYRIE